MATAKAIADRIQKTLAASWKTPSYDTFLAGNQDGEVKGIATTFAPSIEVMRKAVANGQNMIICRESPFWSRPIMTGLGEHPDLRMLEADPAYKWKTDFIAANNLIIYRLSQAWDARVPDGQLQGLAKALGWENYYKPSGGQPWAKNNGFFALPRATLRQTAINIKKSLKTKSIRCGGDPNITVSKAAVWHGLGLLADQRRIMADPGVDLLVIGEQEWEIMGAQYNFDLQAAGIKKGLIVIGHEASEDPGAGEMATWLKSFVSEVPVAWIPTGEPSWMA